ncbi:MAG: hypothetical protein NC081_01415 [Roseburia sp.]|nr:hypothetical protein [Roseburia sp.]
MTLLHKLNLLQPYKRKGFWAILMPTVLLGLFCILQILLPNRQYSFQGSHTFPQGEACDSYVIYQDIPLRAGVYSIELEYLSDTDRNGLCSAQDGTVFTGGLLTNGEHLYSALAKTGYRLWLFENTDKMQFTVSYSGEGSLQTGNITITETNQLWSMLLTILLFFGSLLLFLYMARLYDRKYGISREKKTAFTGLFLICVLACTPYLLGVSISGADLTYHLLRIEGVKDGLLSGQFPVRLEPEWLYGHGYANGVYYCNALLYFPAILRLLGFTVTASYNLYGIALTIATAWISWYCFSRIFQNAKIGLLSSGLYTLSLFRISRLVIISAVGEGSALVFLPLILYGFYRVFCENPYAPSYKSACLPLAFGFAGIIQTHVLTCEMTGLLTLLLCLLCIPKVFHRKRFLALFKGAFWALLLSAWYLVPFLDYYLTQPANIKFASARTIQSNGLPFSELATFFWDDTKVRGLYSVSLGLVLLLAFLPFAVISVYRIYIGVKGSHQRFLQSSQPSEEEHPSLHRLAGLCFLFALLTLLFSLDFFPWDRLQSLSPLLASLISSLQFPFRFLGWTTVCLIALWGYCIWWLEKQGKKTLGQLCCLFLLFSLLTSGLYTLNHINRDHQRYTIYNEEGMGFGYISGAEYLIHGTDQSLLTFEDPAFSDGILLSDYQKDYLDITLHCVNSSSQEGYIDLPLLLYKGYRAYATQNAGQKLPLEITYGNNNLVRILIPAGFEGQLRVCFVSPVYWRIAEVLSLLSLILLLWQILSHTLARQGLFPRRKEAKHV